MSTKLVIVESPNKVRSIAGYLGPDFDVEASVGHIRDLAQPSELPAAQKKGPYGKFAVDVEDGFKPYYVINPDKKKTVAQLRRALKNADELYLATDDDREGEAIAWHLQQVLKPKVPVRRMVFTEITREAVTRALDNTRELDIHLVDAQETRRILDRLVGYEVSPVLWRKVRAGLSAGRVQSVATRLVVERERERMAFRSASYWGVEATFSTVLSAVDVTARQEASFTARLVTLDGRRVATGRDFNDAGELRPAAVKALAVHLHQVGATAVAEAAAQAHAEDEPARSGDHDGQTINGLPEDLSQELRAELLNQGLGPLEPSQSAEVVESPESAAVDAAMVEFVQPSVGEPATAELGRGDHDGQTINGLPEDLVGELVSLVGTGPSSPASPVSASSPSEPDAIRIVLSAVCPQGHPNPTNYTVCRVCGAELNRPAKSVACPPLGRVVTSGGESIELNRPLLVGRNPVADDITSVAEVPLRPLTVASPNHLVSRNHILIDLDAWSVLAQDLGNCNGTVLNRQNEAPVRLSSANPVLLRSGDVLDLGDGQTLAFENLP